MAETRISAALFQHAQRVIPGGVNSPVRAWQAVGGEPLFLRRGKGARVWDVDGREFIDFVGSWGPLILGHAHPRVVRAIQETARDGTSFGAPTAGEVELAEILSQALPSVDLVRLTSSGTEACMTALRLARAYTGRNLVIKFDGCYHGHGDAFLVRAGSGATTLAIPDSAGVPPQTASATLVAPFNDAEAVAALFASHAQEIAAVFVEPVVGNSGVIPPGADFLPRLRELCSTHGALLVFDEVITGFRVAWGGAQCVYGVGPDLTCLGKVIGGGLPLAAVAGRREIMELLAPLGPVYQAGTLSGNPLAVAAGLATLRELNRPDTYEYLDRLGAALEQGLREALAAAGVPGCVNRVGSMWTLFFGITSVQSAEEARRCDRDAFRRWFHAMLEQGVYLPPSPFEAAFLSLAHTEADIDRTLVAARRALGQLRP